MRLRLLQKLLPKLQEHISRRAVAATKTVTVKAAEKQQPPGEPTSWHEATFILLKRELADNIEIVCSSLLSIRKSNLKLTLRRRRIFGQHTEYTAEVS